MTRRQRIVRCALALLAAFIARPAWAQVHTVVVTVPTGVTFNVGDVSVATSGSPSSTAVTFSSPSGFAKTEKLKVSVQADAATFTGPGTTHPAASKVSWTATASNGTASNGTLAAGSYGQVYLSVANLKSTSSGTVNVTWTLAAIAAAGLRSGTHTLTVRWKFEAF